jgi:hypothetical protein
LGGGQPAARLEEEGQQQPQRGGQTAPTRHRDRQSVRRQ